jgi:hypothetical protein
MSNGVGARRRQIDDRLAGYKGGPDSVAPVARIHGVGGFVERWCSTSTLYRSNRNVETHKSLIDQFSTVNT